MDRNLRVLGVATGVRMLGVALYVPFLALFLQHVLGVSYLQIGVIIAGVGLIQLPFNWAGGLLSDRFGRQRLILIGLAAEAAATAVLAYGFALHSLAVAIAAATLGGIVGSATGPANAAYVADFAEGPERTRGFTFLRIGFNAGYSAGVTLGGVLVGIVGFASSVGLAALIIGILTVVLALALAPSPRDRELSKLRRQRTHDPEAVPGTAPPSIGASLRILGRDRIALELLVAFGLAGLVGGQWSVVFPLFVHNNLGISYSLLGVGLAINGLVVVFGQHWTTESVLGWRHTNIAILGLLLYCAPLLVLGAAGLWGFFPVVAFFLCVAALTLGENLFTIPMSTLPSNIAPATEVGSYNGAFGMIGGLSFILAVLLGTAVLSAITNPLLVWVVLVLPGVPSIILFRHAAGRLSPNVDRA